MHIITIFIKYVIKKHYSILKSISKKLRLQMPNTTETYYLSYCDLYLKKTEQIYLV